MIQSIKFEVWGCARTCRLLQSTNKCCILCFWQMGSFFSPELTDVLIIFAVFIVD